MLDNKINKVVCVEAVISGPDVIVKKRSLKIKTKDIKNLLTANDNLGCDITDSIFIISNNYVGHEHEIGIYSIVFAVNDLFGNAVQKTVTINVYCSAPSVFYYDLIEDDFN